MKASFRYRCADSACPGPCRDRERPTKAALFGLPATGAITFWVPIVIFAFLFGLAIDYEVFILARMREAYDQTGDTSTAVIEGIGPPDGSSPARR